MKRISHHWHVILDDQGRATPAAIEHDHRARVGVRHAHYREHDVLLRDLLAMGTDPTQARVMALRLDRTAYTTLSFDREPAMVPQLEGAALERTLHPEIRRSLN